MKVSNEPQTTKLIPIDRITVVNPRLRNRKIFREIVTSIAELGLKRPITVTRHIDGENVHFGLICGQGRLEAYEALGQKEIPAIVADADIEECMLMSLVENLARRQHRPLDLLHDIEGLAKRGYSDSDICRKTGLTIAYVRGVNRLLEKGEQRLLRAVESGQIPVSTAVDIASASDGEMQAVLQNAYENNILRGHKLLAAKRLIEQRRKRGRGLEVHGRRRPQTLSSATLIRAYREDVDRKRLLVRRSEATRNRLIFIIEALRTLFNDDNLVTLMHAEGLDTLPQTLSARVHLRETD